MLYCV